MESDRSGCQGRSARWHADSQGLACRRVEDIQHDALTALSRSLVDGQLLACDANFRETARTHDFLSDYRLVSIRMLPGKSEVLAGSVCTGEAPQATPHNTPSGRLAGWHARWLVYRDPNYASGPSKRRR